MCPGKRLLAGTGRPLHPLPRVNSEPRSVPPARQRPLIHQRLTASARTVIIIAALGSKIKAERKRSPSRGLHPAFLQGAEFLASASAGGLSQPLIHTGLSTKNLLHGRPESRKRPRCFRWPQGIVSRRIPSACTERLHLSPACPIGRQGGYPGRPQPISPPPSSQYLWSVNLASSLSPNF